MPEITLLSPALINKIAAGEVIERPASVVKELVENSIDAGSTKIDIDIQKAGNELISVSDNGCGITAEQLPLALAQHATSKIKETDDLFRIGSFGFRGEALASIAEVSQLYIKSCSDGSPHGSELRVEGGTVISGPVPCGMRRGTTIEIRNLFFNTPVRRKFLKGANTEFGHISEAFVRLAIPNTHIHFSLKHNGRTIYDLPQSLGIRERISRIFGADFASKLINIDSAGEGIHITGYVGHPDISRSNYSCQYFFLNKRFIRDKSLQHALVQAYRGLMMVGRYPVAFLEIEMSPELVDVNVHPTKMEVRFLESNNVYGLLLSGIRNQFLRSNMKSRPVSDFFEREHEYLPDPNIDTVSQDDAEENRRQQIRADILNWSAKPSADPNSPAPIEKPINREETYRASARSILPPPSRSVSEFIPFSLTQKSFEQQNSDKESLSSSFPSPPSPLKDTDPVLVGREQERETDSPPTHFSSTSQIPHSPDGKPVIQIHNCFLVFETETGMAIVDQHALHERILYEKIKSRLKENGKLESQRLLVPETVDLSPEEFACALENQETFREFGILADPFGGSTILISGYPSILQGISPQALFLEILGTLMKRGKENIELEDMLDEMTRRCACRAAVKEGDKLRGDAMEELLIQAQVEVNSHHCPHGRPSILLLSVSDLEKMFKRT